MRYLVALPIIAMSACGPAADPTGSVSRLSLEYKVGEELMRDCNAGRNCAEYLAFKKDFEESAGYFTTFESSLEAHKARVAAGKPV